MLTRRDFLPLGARCVGVVSNDVRNRSQADPFVIATAEILQGAVVTGEKPRGNLEVPKIPDVCDARKIRCIGFLEMLRELGWKF